MRLSLALLLCCGLLAPALAIDGGPAFEDPVLQARYESLGRELRCLVCQNQSIADSNAILAADLRRELREMLETGATDEQILTFMVERYGDFVRLKPPFARRTLLLWAAPLILMLIGAVVVVRVVLQRAAAYEEGDETDEAAGQGTAP